MAEARAYFALSARETLQEILFGPFSAFYSVLLVKCRAPRPLARGQLSDIRGAFSDGRGRNLAVTGRPADHEIGFRPPRKPLAVVAAVKLGARSGISRVALIGFSERASTWTRGGSRKKGAE